VTDFGSLADRLDTLVADLDELAFDRLREAVAQGAISRPTSDKELTKARRAVEKAAHILRNLDEP
jgi:hypothetical protein